ncbi:MAG TPA: hypothetical protein VFH55_09265 [Nitrospiria bacterium]|nr:hypothetical protein [Nitrospiria bacterium]
MPQPRKDPIEKETPLFFDRGRFISQNNDEDEEDDENDEEEESEEEEKNEKREEDEEDEEEDLIQRLTERTFDG